MIVCDCVEEILYLDSNQLTSFLSSSVLRSLLLLRKSIRLQLFQIDPSAVFSPHRSFDARTIGELYLYDNRLNGTIPEEIGSPVLLRKFTLDAVRDTIRHGLLTSDFSFLFIDTIFLDGNDFSGSIPSSFGYLRHLGKFHFSCNLYICIRSHRMEPISSAESLYLFGNKLEGTIPATFGWMEKLRKYSYKLSRQCS